MADDMKLLDELEAKRASLGPTADQWIEDDFDCDTPIKFTEYALAALNALPLLLRLARRGLAADELSVQLSFVSGACIGLQFHDSMETVKPKLIELKDQVDAALARLAEKDGA